MARLLLPTRHERNIIACLNTQMHESVVELRSNFGWSVFAGLDIIVQGKNSGGLAHSRQHGLQLVKIFLERGERFSLLVLVVVDRFVLEINFVDGLPGLFDECLEAGESSFQAFAVLALGIGWWW